MPPSFPAALPIARLVLKALVILNWIYAAIVLAILIALFVNPYWTVTALGFESSDQPGALILGARLIAALGLVAVPLSLIVLRRLLAMTDTVRAGDPFLRENAARLQAIAWALLGQQVLQLLVSLVARVASSQTHRLHIAAFSPSGWLAVILLFVLARVFAEGTAMRDDLAGTV